MHSNMKLTRDLRLEMRQYNRTMARLITNNILNEVERRGGCRNDLEEAKIINDVLTTSMRDFIKDAPKDSKKCPVRYSATKTDEVIANLLPPKNDESLDTWYAYVVDTYIPWVTCVYEMRYYDPRNIQ